MRNPTWKVILVWAAVVFGIVLIVPNLIPEKTLDALPGWVPKQRITLGLDLQGGSYMLLQVDTAAVVKDRLDTLSNETRSQLREARIGYSGIGLQGQSVVATLTDAGQLQAALERLKSINQTVGGSAFVGVGTTELDITGDGNRVTLKLNDAAVTARVSSAVTQSLEVVRRRIDELGTREPTIQRQGADRILVQVPGEKDPANIKRLLGQTARLSFHMVDMNADPSQPPPGDFVLPGVPGSPGPQQYVLNRRAELQGDNLTDAQPTFQNNEAVVSFRLDSIGSRKFAQVTQDNVGKFFAIVLDDKVISAPRIREPITGGAGVISGSFTVESANELAVLLRAGALPAPLTVVEERSVGAELGADSIRAGAIASGVAVVAVVIFMMIYYGLFGVFANLALVVNIILILAGLSLLGSTLTLPGIAGIVLTIGMAVDSNVLIFERIREEMKHGRGPVSSIQAGFDKAMRAVIDANVTHLIASLVLFEFGTGPIKGFAITLSIGVLTTMFTAVTVTRVVILYWHRRTRPATIPL
ncbi:SecD/SecF fusion protein [Arboricoccus pini]|uniref:Protein translocase subunit SecD n=1 Tax=Arboricoccus pini TaxID=1963835 RepID=A0A212QPY3_9PROT|nr:protein translocase subunit SecD [Arboricoccus pini]SNB61504.1 SecD/SecF fusion protein [Arboricoccus pini]